MVHILGNTLTSFKVLSSSRSQQQRSKSSSFFQQHHIYMFTFQEHTKNIGPSNLASQIEKSRS
jgi:hypothetical protein